jgi:hypothetical protein
MVFPELESCGPRNMGFGDKIQLDLNLPVINRARRSDRVSWGHQTTSLGLRRVGLNRSSTEQQPHRQPRGNLQHLHVVQQ